MLSRNYHVNLVFGLKTVMEHGEETVGIRWQVDANNRWLLRNDVSKKAGILMSETVVILPPYVTCKEDIQAGKLVSPRDFLGYLVPFRMLVEHTRDDVNEGFVGVEQSMTTGEQIALKPPFTLMFRENFQNTSISRYTIVSTSDF